MAQGKEYGSALFMLSREENTTDRVKEDIETVLAVLKENPEYVKLLDTPALSKAERLRLIDEAFANNICYSVLNVIKILSERHCVYSLGEAVNAFTSLYNEFYQIEHVEAVTAVPMSSGQLKAMKEKLERLTGKTVVIKNTVSPEILGGVVLRYSGIQLDGSVKSKLDEFAAGLRNTTI